MKKKVKIKTQNEKIVGTDWDTWHYEKIVGTDWDTWH